MGEDILSVLYPLNRTIRIAVLTISDTRITKTDKGGKTINALAKQAHFEVVRNVICKDDVGDIQKHLKHFFEKGEIDAVITTGGSGIAKRDSAIEAISPVLDKKIDGFGELFRMLSFTEDIGTSAMLSRAMAGISHDKVIFVLPGSIGAIKLAMNQLIIPELEHLVFEAIKHKIKDQGGSRR